MFFFMTQSCLFRLCLMPFFLEIMFRRHYIQHSGKNPIAQALLLILISNYSFNLSQRLFSLNNTYQRNASVINGTGINPFSANFTKWSNTLKQFVGNLLRNYLSVFGHFVRLALKGLKGCTLSNLPVASVHRRSIIFPVVLLLRMKTFSSFVLTVLTVFLRNSGTQKINPRKNLAGCQGQ